MDRQFSQTPEAELFWGLCDFETFQPAKQQVPLAVAIARTQALASSLRNAIAASQLEPSVSSSDNSHDTDAAKNATAKLEPHRLELVQVERAEADVVAVHAALLPTMLTPNAIVPATLLEDLDELPLAGARPGETRGTSSGIAVDKAAVGPLPLRIDEVTVMVRRTK
jgi:hypothetical protein